MKEILIKRLTTKSIVWFQSSNQYLVAENSVAKIIEQLQRKIAKKVLSISVSKEIDVPINKALDFIKDVENLMTTFTATKIITSTKLSQIPKKFNTKKYYQINNFVFFIEYKSEFEESLVHPKFAHLEIDKTAGYTYHYQVFSDDTSISFFVNGKEIGTWSLEEVHFFQGKFSMQIVQHIHQKEEKEWLGVFHASAISNGKESMLFLGDSGNGKSTSLALLQTNGFTCLADDFVPMDAKKQEVYSFPSAISIKRNSLETLLPIYPELQTSAEYHFKKLNKIVRYLPPNNSDYTRHLPCKALVFIKYVKDSELVLAKISNTKAFEQLVPDSWLSPIPKNTQLFLDWFAKLPCYQLTYSNNNQMIETVTKIFNNDL